MARIELDEDDGFMEIVIKRKSPDTGEIVESVARVDAFRLGAVFYDLYQQWGGREEEWAAKVCEVLAAESLTGLSTKNALTIQKTISKQYGESEKKSEPTPVTESAPGSPTPTDSMLSTSESATAT